MKACFTGQAILTIDDHEVLEGKEVSCYASAALSGYLLVLVGISLQ